jgi:hypothetical protein
MKDETDKEIIPEVLPVLEELRAKARAEIADTRKQGTVTNIFRIGHAYANGRKLNCRLYVCKTSSQTWTEQFEYYDYRYNHQQPFSP